MTIYISNLFLQNELTYQDVICLSLPETSAEGPDGTKVNTVGKLNIKLL